MYFHITIHFKFKYFNLFLLKMNLLKSTNVFVLNLDYCQGHNLNYLLTMKLIRLLKSGFKRLCGLSVSYYLQFPNEIANDGS